MATLRHSLLVQLWIGAILVAAAYLVAAAVVYHGSSRTAQLLRNLRGAEYRMEVLSSLSTQIIVIAATMRADAERPAGGQVSKDAIATAFGNVERNFGQIEQSLGESFSDIASQGKGAIERHEALALNLARMKAIFGSFRGRLVEGGGGDLTSLTASFSFQFEPVMGNAIHDERIIRDNALAGLDRIRDRLAWLAWLVAFGSAGIVLLFLMAFLRPLLSRIERLREVARKIGREEFDLGPSDARQDEIGKLNADLADVALKLAARKQAVDEEAKRLNETVAAKTAELREANIELSQVDENRRRFFADISHEMRTPLTVIITEAELGQSGDADAKESFGVIGNRALLLSRRVDDLLRLARSQRGEIEVSRELIELRTLALAAIEEHQRHAKRRGISLLLEGPEVAAIGDPSWSRQVISGLIDNALRHAAGAEAIVVRTFSESNNPAVAVIDNGCGIAPERQSRALRRFGQVGGSAGFGLGLSVARAIAAAQGGELELTSPVPEEFAIGGGAGTMVMLRLPAPEERHD